MTETSAIPPEPTMTRQVIIKPDGRRLMFYTFVQPTETADAARRPDEMTPDVGASLEPSAG
ncbi:hypothetical protein [Chloracidobacterium thermophilum]|uniref:hypothetical protein n=1 Tax=Chloracidobacterium thermophilum TaxID=458033 RepID=UPI000738A16B|nr:hypothetical protein [Chloracidobacterium thermophilum]